MARVKVTLKRNEGNIRAVVTGPKGYSGQLVKDTIRRAENYAKVYAPVRTGNLRASLGTRYTTRLDRMHGEVGTSVKYAMLVHNGTGPHIIRPRQAKVLKFKAGGRTVYARKVNHPGTRARPFLTNGLRSAVRGTPFGLSIG